MNTQQIHSIISKEQSLRAKIHLGPGHCSDFGFGSAASNNTISKDYGIPNHSIADQRARNNMSIAPASDPAFDNEAMNLGMNSNRPSSLCNHILRYSLVLLNGLFLKVLISISSLFVKRTGFIKRTSSANLNQQGLSSSAAYRLEWNYTSTGIQDFPMTHSAPMHFEFQQPEELTIGSSSMSNRNLTSSVRNLSLSPDSFSSQSFISSDHHYSNHIRARFSTFASAFIHSSASSFIRQSTSCIPIAAVKLIPFEIIYLAKNIPWSIHKKFAQSSLLDQFRFHFSRPSFSSHGYLLQFQSKRFSF